MPFRSRVFGLSCFACGNGHDPHELQTVCRMCGMPLRVEYDLASVRLAPSDLVGRAPSLWRYREVLPIDPEDAVSLVEGFTPLVPIERNLWVKDEARNPTGSFKARGMSVAVSMARGLGARALQAPSAGNAAGALAAYGAAAGMPVTVAMPEDTPRPFIDECHHYGAEVHLVRGTIADAGRFLRERAAAATTGGGAAAAAGASGAAGAMAGGGGALAAFDVSTLREPYRVEGKKTMAYELYEQMNGALPDVIVYPTGGGTGLVGMWKAFDEMEALGWPGLAGRPRPRLVSVQAAGCAPVVAAFDSGAAVTTPWASPATDAYGLRVPSPIGGFLCLRALRETGGTAVAVDEAVIEPAARDLASRSGIDVCPEGGAAWAAVSELRRRGFLDDDDRVVVFNTGTGLKYR